MSHQHQLKALGYLRDVELKDLDMAWVDVTHDIYEHATANRLCGHPDFPDEEIAKSDDPERLARQLSIVSDDGGYDVVHAECIRNCHHGLLEAERATGSGSWGICQPDLYPNRHAIKVFVDYDSFASHHKRTVTREELVDIVKVPVWSITSEEEILDRFMGKSKLDVAIWLGILETYRIAGCAHILTDSHDGSQIHVRARRIPGSTIGIGWFPSAGCGSHVEFHIDNSWEASLHPLAGLIGHECGHTNKLPHTFSGQNTHRGVMSYRRKYPYVGYSKGMPPYDRPYDPSWNLLKRYYGSFDSPIPPPGGPEPPDPPDDDAPLVLPGEFEGSILSDGRVAWRGSCQAYGHEYIAWSKGGNKYELRRRPEF